MALRPRLTNDQIKGRLIFTVGIGLTIVFVGAIAFMLYGLIFVTQPQNMAEADAEAWSVISPVIMSLSGGLLGVLAANGLKSNKDKTDDH